MNQDAYDLFEEFVNSDLIDKVMGELYPVSWKALVHG